MWAVEKHLAGCSECACVASEMENTVALLRTSERFDTGSDFMAKLHARLDTLPAESVQRASIAESARDWVAGLQERFGARRAPVLTLGLALSTLAILIVTNGPTREVLPVQPAPEALSRNVAFTASSPFDDPVAAKVEADNFASSESRSDSENASSAN